MVLELDISIKQHFTDICHRFLVIFLNIPTTTILCCHLEVDNQNYHITDICPNCQFIQCCRLLLSALHFNENCQRQQALTKEGEAKWTISYPKYKKGLPVAKEVKTAITYGMYVHWEWPALRMLASF